nr:hypothetical protein [Tanacetum cinerariifolium]
MNLESLEDDSIIVVDESKYEEDKDEGIHVDSDVETEDTLVPKPPSRSIQLKELIDQVLILQSQKRKLELEKNKVEAEVALLSAQPSFLDELFGGLGMKRDYRDVVEVVVVMIGGVGMDCYFIVWPAEETLASLVSLIEQDPLDKLNDLANKKRKHVDDIHDYFRPNKRLKLSVQYEDHLAGTMLNKPVLGMIMFNFYHKKDFVTIEDFRNFPNEMLRIVQEIFFRFHQGPGLNDHARTFSALLLAEVDKRNLNPHKQMRSIEKQRQ